MTPVAKLHDALLKDYEYMICQNFSQFSIITPYLFSNTSRLFATGFPATLGIRENLENEFPIFQSGKTHGIWDNYNNKIMENSGNL